MKRFDPARLLSLAALTALVACSGSGGGSTGETTAGGKFVVLNTDPVNGQTIYLNDPVSVDFSQPVDLDSASLTTMSFQSLDQLGTPVPELVTGNFAIGTSPGDSDPGRRLVFVPTFASNNTYSNGGLRAGRRYLVQLVGGEGATTVLRAVNGQPLAQAATFQFATRDGTQSAQLYRNPLPGGPAKVGFEISTATNLDDVPLGLFGAPPLELRLHFNQALNPSDVNVPVAVDTDPLTRDEALKGRIYLEYKDPTDNPSNPLDFTWIPADAEIERNDLTGATLVLRPIGVLPNNAVMRVIVEPTVEDIAGESNAANQAYNRVFAEFRTRRDYTQQWNGLVEEFDALSAIDPLAAFPEAQAEVGPGYIKAGFAFEGNSTTLEYQPTANEVVLNTSFTQIVPANGLPFTVSGGVFNFRNVTIPQGVTVVGQGPNPMIWLCSGRFTVSGTLSVRGGNGARVDTLNSANFAKAGGIGACGGGNGGDGTPSATLRDLRGGTGRGPLQVAGRGGRGGYLACESGCYQGSGYNGSGGGSGGGGGTMATQGDPYYRGQTATTPVIPNTPPTVNTAFQQKFGYGGAGCSGGSGTRTGTQILRGGEPGDKVFTDSRLDNDFWGSGINLAGTGGRTLRIVGEIAIPMGGGGGGGGGDTANQIGACATTGSNPINDYSGGGGGGGGGVLIVKALEEIVITASGRVLADGGHGGGGEQVGSCGEAGGGGGGAGGMVVLMSAKGIIMEAHGNAAANRYLYGAPAGSPFTGNDYTFAVSADGGVCLTGGFGATNITSKYRTQGQAPDAGSLYDQDPLGGFGGLGIVQLMVPPGTSETSNDGTNTVLDDNIHFFLPNTYQPGTVITYGPGAPAGLQEGVRKEHLLAWRGIHNGTQYVSDNGNPVNVGVNEGDIRPSPTLLPCPFSGKSRARSKWIDTGVSQRRPLTAEDNLPRGIVTGPNSQVGPIFEFGGTRLDVGQPGYGYVKYESAGSSITLDFPTPVGATPIASVSSSASYLGKPAYRITATSPAFGDADRYVQYEAELLNASSSKIASFRILSHTSTELLVDPSTELLPQDAAQVRIRAKFFQVVTNNAEGLGATYQPVLAGGVLGPAAPRSNVRIGFAFHRDPDPTNILDGRFPGATDPTATENDFLFDLDSPELQAWIDLPVAQGGCGGVPPRFVQWDVLFDMAFDPGTGAQSITPSTPRPELRYLRLPFRF